MDRPGMSSTELELEPSLGSRQPEGWQVRAQRGRYPLAVALQALAIFTGIGASAGLFLAQLGVRQAMLADFLDSNTLPAPARTQLTLGLFLGGATGAVLSLVYLLARR